MDIHAPRLILATLLAALSHQVFANCWSEAADRYGVPEHLLRAVARVESGFNPNAINVNSNGSRDRGLMQINDSHVPALSRYGIDERRLLDPCTNVNVGAWVLADAFARHGRTWEAIGAYNASCRTLSKLACVKVRQNYAWRVYRGMAANAEKAPQAPVPTPASLPVTLVVRVAS